MKAIPQAFESGSFTNSFHLPRSFSGAKVLYLLIHIPAIIECHLLAHIVIVHVSTTDYDYEQ